MTRITRKLMILAVAVFSLTAFLATSVASGQPMNGHATAASIAGAPRNHVRPRTTQSTPNAARRVSSWDLINAWWFWNPAGGYSLAVMPNAAGRSVAAYDARRVFNDAVSMAGVWPFSPSVYNSLYNQFRCHAYFYWLRNKLQWNLDTWRPDVGFWSTVAAQCNPQ
jgi:hypothetical protein